MDVLEVMSHVLLSAGYIIIDGRLEIIARKVIIRGFRALRMVSWSRMDNPAAAEIRIRHGQHEPDRVLRRSSGLKQIACIKYSLAILELLALGGKSY